jgi:hypothetical protein
MQPNEEFDPRLCRLVRPIDEEIDWSAFPADLWHACGPLPDDGPLRDDLSLREKPLLRLRAIVSQS